MITTSTEATSWLRRFHPAPDTGPRLVCLPHAGGSATYYFPVSRALSATMEVIAVQYPGRQDRRNEPFVDDIGELADSVTEAIRDSDSPNDRPASGLPARPLILFGHSMGATIGYEVAARLEDSGVEILTFFASGRRAPSHVRSENVHQRDDAGIIAELRRLQGTNSDLLGDDEIVQMILPALRNDYRAVERYRPAARSPLRCPIVALTGDSDPQVTAEEAAAWADHTTGPFRLHTYSGGHFFLDSHAPAIVREIGRLAPGGVLYTTDSPPGSMGTGHSTS